MKNTILIVDDDKELTQALSKYLSQEGFQVLSVADGELGLKKALNQCFDAIILDIVLPKRNGFDILKAVRKHAETPVLILSSRNDDVDKIICLELGADDYLQKPCSPQELLARLRSILRRSQKLPLSRPVIEHLGIHVDCNTHIVKHHGVVIELTNAEFNILEMLIKSPGQAFSKEELTEHALGRKFTAFDRSIDVHISNLRNKLNDLQESEGVLKTVRGFGYMLQP